MVVLNTLVPLLALITLGAALRRWNFAPPSFFREANRLLYWIAMPALLFYQTAEATIQRRRSVARFPDTVSWHGRRASPSATWSPCCYAFPESQSARSSRARIAAIWPMSDLPVVLLSLAASHGQPMSGSDSLAVLVGRFPHPVYNLTAVVVLLAGRPVTPDAGHTARENVDEPWSPTRWCSPAPPGCFSLIFGWKLPPVIRQTCVTLGQMSTGLALLSIGASLTLRLPAPPDRAYERVHR